jgi:hypothetical protein
MTATVKLYLLINSVALLGIFAVLHAGGQLPQPRLSVVHRRDPVRALIPLSPQRC